MRPARSKSRSAAAARIWSVSSPTISERLPRRKRSTWLTWRAYSTVSIMPAQTPGPRPTW